MNIKSIIPPKEMVEIALRKAAKESKAKGGKKGGRKGLRSLKERESKKIFIFSKELAERLGKAIAGFPRMESLEPFHRELADLLVDEAKTRKALAQLHASKKLVRAKGNDFIKEIWRQESEARIKEKTRIAIGRIASIAKRTGKSAEALNKAGKALREIPSVSLEDKGVILAGFPNTGKTTTLKRLTGSEPKIAAYPFTTQKINIGHFSAGHSRIQVIDTPGLLDREIGKRNDIEKKAILALKHLASVIVFIVDTSKSSGCTLKEQFSLIKGISSAFPKIPVLVALNKIDISSEAETAEAEKLAAEEGLKSVRQGKERPEKPLREEILRAMKLL